MAGIDVDLNPKDVYDKLAKLQDDIGNVAKDLAKVVDAVKALAPAAGGAAAKIVSSYEQSISTGLTNLSGALTPAVVDELLGASRWKAMVEHATTLAKVDMKQLLGGAEADALIAVHALFQPDGPPVAADTFRTSFPLVFEDLCDEATALAGHAGMTLPFSLDLWKARAKSVLAKVPDPLLAAVGGHLQLIDLGATRDQVKALNAQLAAQPQSLHAKLAAGSLGDPSPPSLATAAVWVKAALTVLRSFISCVQAAVPGTVGGALHAAIGLNGLVGAGAALGATVLGELGVEVDGDGGLNFGAVSVTGLVGGLIAFVADLIDVGCDVVLSLNVQDTLARLKPPLPIG